MGRNWNQNLLNAHAAQQDRIARGDVVRAYDFPGQRDDSYLDGIVKEVEAGDRVHIHVTREVRRGEEQRVTRASVWSPLGASMFNGALCVFLLAKRERRA